MFFANLYLITDTVPDIQSVKQAAALQQDMLRHQACWRRAKHCSSLLSFRKIKVWIKHCPAKPLF